MNTDQILAQLGPCVLLAIPLGKKGPNTKEWQKLTLAHMTPEYLASLNGHKNIGVSLGAASQGLCSIDVDNDDELERFLSLNPALQGSLMSRGVRGANIWVRIKDDYPKSYSLWKKGSAKSKETKFGEWRATGNQTVIHGKHPSGCLYFNNGKRPIEIEFSHITWPESLDLPWVRKPEAQPEQEASRRDIDRELTIKCGPAYTITPKGAVIINQNYFVQRFCLENLVIFEQDENQFYVYCKETGAWQKAVPEIIKEKMRSDWERLTHSFDEPLLAFKIGDHLLNSLVNGIKAHSGCTKVFKRLKHIIHCKNGMLKIKSDGSWELLPFSPEYYARNPIPIAWNPEAVCPKFLAFLNFALPGDDVSLFIRWFGSVLLTGNAAQRILLLVGKAATGKSTIAEVVEMVIGWTNCTALRTRLLHERFEIGRLFGYSLLTAKDVPGKFLEEKGAQALKKLVGHDYTPGERKGSMESVPVYGDFDCLVTCNERLLVSLEGETDVEAWRRRLMMLEFLNELPEEQRIDNYAQVLFAQEAEGILAAAITGSIVHMAELEESGNFKLTPEQKSRVNLLLVESESVKYFVTERVLRQRGGEGLSTEELVTAYMDYCDERNWRPYGIKQVERSLPDIMMSIHGVHVGAHIVRNGKRVRGYPHVAIAQVTEPENDQQGGPDQTSYEQGEF
jgi:uncharacterized protein DUF5906/D5-like protein